jgi:hypothetical protein
MIYSTLRPVLQIVLPLLLAACVAGSSGQDETKTYDVQGFNHISAATGVIVTLKQGAFAVSAKSTGGDLSHLRIELSGKQLKIANEGLLTLGHSPTYEVTVAAPDVKELEAVAGAQLSAVDLNLSDVKLLAAAGGIMKLSGTCWAANVDAAAGGIINASGLKCQSADIKAAAGGQVEITATDKANASAAVGGIVTISGNPPNVTKDATVGGVINVK